MTVVVSVTIVTTDPEVVVRAGEAFNRAASGLALEGIDVAVSYGIPEEDTPPPAPEQP